MESTQKHQLDFRKEQIWWLLLPLVMAVVVAVSFPWFEMRVDQAKEQQCQENMESLALWMLAYAAHNDGFLPSGPNWPDEISDHIKDPDVLVCPAASGSAPVSYALNPALAGANLNDVDDRHSVVLLYEGSPGEIVRRHRGGANYAFVDGFVQWREIPPAGLEIENADLP